MSFSSLGLSQKVLDAVNTAGYTTPTPIQEQAIPEVLEGRDVLGIAQTGTGKTASFTLPMLTKLETGRARARMPRSLILEPTRELAVQVEQNFSVYGANHNLTVALLIGGVSFEDQLRKLDRGADVLIATPGRLLDHVGRGKLLLTGISILVIDEADRMLDMGFIPDIEKICKLIPPRRQTLFFSATMAPEIQRLTKAFLKSPVRIEVAPPSSTAATVTQLIQDAPNDFAAKRQVLRDVIKSEDLKNAIVFCNRKRNVDIVAKSLIRHGFNARCLHGDMAQHSRTETLDSFRAGTTKILVASDVAARGLDIPEVSHVINFDVPIHAEDYIHRIGRTGRAGHSGRAITLVSKSDQKYLGSVEKLIGNKLEKLTASDSVAPAKTQEKKPRSKQPKSAESASTAQPNRTRGDKRTSRQKKPADVKVSNVADQEIHSHSSSSAEMNKNRFSGDNVPAFLLQVLPGKKKSGS